MEVAPGTGLEAHSVSVPIRSSEPTAVRVALRRASAVVDVRIGADLSVMEGWSSALPLPAGIAFEVWHVGLNAMVAGGHTDGEGCAVVMEEAGVYLNQMYELRVLESDLVCAAAVGFVASDSRTAVELLVSRRCVNVDVQVRYTTLSRRLHSPKSAAPGSGLYDDTRCSYHPESRVLVNRLPVVSLSRYQPKDHHSNLHLAVRCSLR